MDNQEYRQQSRRRKDTVTTISRPYLLLAVLLSTLATLIVLAR
jgi:hypothetical protein